MLDISRNYLSLIETGAKVPKKSLRTIIDHWIDHGAGKYDAPGGVVQTMHGNGRQAGRDMIPLGHCARASSTLARGTIIFELVADKAGSGLLSGGQGFKQAALAMGETAGARLPGTDARLGGTQQGGQLALGEPQGLAECF